MLPQLGLNFDELQSQQQKRDRKRQVREYIRKKFAHARFDKVGLQQDCDGYVHQENKQERQPVHGDPDVVSTVGTLLDAAKLVHRSRERVNFTVAVGAEQIICPSAIL